MIQMHLGRFLVRVASALCVALNEYPEPVSAQEAYPSKPIHILVTTAAGGAGDLVARALADRMSESMGQPQETVGYPGCSGLAVHEAWSIPQSGRDA
jgi:tripartite-type tricarboxylate transporter receptor subunit TctC